MASKGKRIHIVPTAEGWAGRAEGQSRAVGTASTQKAMQDLVRAQLQNARDGGEMITHGRDNKIRASDTINRKDPHPPQG